MAIGRPPALPSFGTATPQSDLSKLFAKFAFDFSRKSTTLSTSPTHLKHLRAAHCVPYCTRPYGVAARGGQGLRRWASWAGPLRKPTVFLSSRAAATGASCVFIKGKGPQGVGRR